MPLYGQVEPKRLITDLDGIVWLRIEDAGYMDKEGRIWLVGRVKWRVVRNGRSYWSTVVEQKVGVCVCMRTRVRVYVRVCNMQRHCTYV